jgi:hypothetical protein
MGCFCDLVSGFGLRPNCMQMYTQFGSQLLRSATASSFLRGSSASMARGLQGCFCIAAKRGVYFWKIYIVLSERLWPSFFFFEVWFRQSYLQRHFVGNWTFELSH